MMQIIMLCLPSSMLPDLQIANYFHPTCLCKLKIQAATALAQNGTALMKFLKFNYAFIALSIDKALFYLYLHTHRQQAVPFE